MVCVSIVLLHWVCWLCTGGQHGGVCFYCPPSLGLLAMYRRTARWCVFLLSSFTGFVGCVQENSTVVCVSIVLLHWVCWLCAGEQHGGVCFYCPPSLGLLAMYRRTARWCVFLLSSFTGFVGCVQENSTVVCVSIVLLHWVCWLCAGEQHGGVFEPEQEQDGDPRGPTHRRCPE